MWLRYFFFIIFLICFWHLLKEIPLINSDLEMLRAIKICFFIAAVWIAIGIRWHKLRPWADKEDLDRLFRR